VLAYIRTRQRTNEKRVLEVCSNVARTGTHLFLSWLSSHLKKGYAGPQADVCNKPSRNEHSIAKQLNKVKRNVQANFVRSITVANSELNNNE
jgi:hypothetical protein